MNRGSAGHDLARRGKASELAPIATGGACPVAAFQKLISGKYKLRIVWDLRNGPLRYSEIGSGLLRGLAGTREIAPRVLSRELKALAQAGLIDRTDYGTMPPKVDYRLTAKGRSFVPVVAAIRDWGDRHLNSAGSRPAPDGGGATRAGSLAAP